jgi:flagellar FliJ protein
MSAVKSLLLAMELATRRRDQAGVAVVRAEQARLHALDQLEQLESYSTETESKWIAAAQVGSSPELMRHHYQFMDRLGHAIGLQKTAEENSLRKLASEKKTLLEAEVRLMSLQQVLKVRQADIARASAKREQKQMDEFAALQYARARAERHNGSTYEH